MTTDRQPIGTLNGLSASNEEERRRLTANIERQPWRYIGQERVSFSVVPVLHNRKLESRVMALRGIVHFDGKGYHTMPSGLARCGITGQTYLPEDQVGGICKDTWVLAPEPVEFNSLWLEQPMREENAPMSGFFTSSMVENLFWTGRYAERAYCLTQSIRALLENFEQCLISGADARSQCLEEFWRGLRFQAGYLNESMETLTPLRPALRDLAAFSMDSKVTGSLPAAMQGMVNAAFSVRENWSRDTWRVINRIQGLTGEPDEASQTLNEVQDHLDSVLLLLEAFIGQVTANMTRTPGWQFLEIGRQIEHSIMMLDLLQGTMEVHVQDELVDYYLLESLLRANECLITYRRVYRTTPNITSVLELLLCQHKNPKSLSFQFDELEERLESLSEELNRDLMGEWAPKLKEARNQLRNADLSAWSAPTADGRFEALGPELSKLRSLVTTIAEELGHDCFKHAKQRLHPLTYERHHLDEGRR
jgi:uncharacterized alpha-E superfamily protein